MRKADVMFKLGMRKTSADKVGRIKKRQKHADVILRWSLSTSDYIMYHLQFETYIQFPVTFFADKRL